MPEQLRKFVVIDGKGHLLGRLAATVAKQLLMGTKIAVVRTEEILISGPLKRNRAIATDRMNKRMNTNPRRGPFHPRTPATMFFKVVKAMIPYKSTRGKQALLRLQCYEGVPSRFQKNKRVCVPKALKSSSLKSSTKITKLGRLATDLGWKYGRLIDSMEKQRKIYSAVRYHRIAHFRKLWKKASETASKNAKLSEINKKLAKLGY